MGIVKSRLPTKDEILTTWNKASLLESKLIPKVPAVYVLVAKQEILYVGTSKLLRQRICLNLFDHPMTFLIDRDIKSKPGQGRYEAIREYLDSEYSLEVYWWNFNPSERKERYKLERGLINCFKPPLNSFSGIGELKDRYKWLNTAVSCTVKV
ncbi:hypothetical protein [Chroococcidiopsis sp.]|uniref:hypothetical protein n=1 Tax=Chroococcidiopsis sp. TaxID=3088168 RepID=UPI003F3F6141